MDKKLARELVKTRNVVRQKFKLMKADIAETQRRKEKELKPLSEPLKELLTSIKREVPVKREPTFLFEELPELSAKASSPKKFVKSTYEQYLPMGGLTFLEDQFLSETQSPLEALQEQASTERINEAVEQSRQVLQALSEMPGYEEYLSTFDPLPRTYIDARIRGDESDFDSMYGIHHDPEIEKFTIGNAQVDFKGKDIQLVIKRYIGPDVKLLYEGTPGMYELLFKNHPVGYTRQDLDNYMDLLERTGAYYRNYDNTQQIQPTRSEKYLNIIRPYLVKIGRLKEQIIHAEEPRRRSLSVGATASQLPRLTRARALKMRQEEKQGGGLLELSNKKIDYVYYDDPNELVERLKLLLASQNAGHTGHNNEIISIIEELREANLIK